MKNKKGLIALVAVLGIVLSATGATYAWFSYSKTGSRENTISSGAITFHYEEGSRVISTDDMMPMTDEQGKAQTDFFEFDIASQTPRTLDVPYYITVRRTADSEASMDNIVKVYLTKVDNNGNETQVALSKFNNLSGYTNSEINIPVSEKTLYNDTVLAGTRNYTQKYRLRMWIDYDANYLVQTPVVAYCERNSDHETVTTIDSVEATITNCVAPDYTWHPADTTNNYPLEGKSYALTVNVYGVGNDIGTTEANYRSSTEITELTVGDTTLTSTDGINYSEEMTIMDENITKNIEIETENPGATVTVENLTPTAMVVEDNGIRKMSTNVSIPLEIKVGTNTFRITVTSANKLDTKVYNLTVTASLPPAPSNFHDDSWETIVYAIRHNTEVAANVYKPVSGGPSAQSTKTIDMGTLGTHTIRMSNTTACTTQTSTTACGFVIEFVDIISEQQLSTYNNFSGGYPATNVGFNYVTQTVYNVIPANIRQYIISTNVVSGHRSWDSNNFTTPNQKLYLLSSYEVLGNTTYDSATSATRQLDYYSTNSSVENLYVKYLGNQSKYWWTRTASSGSYDRFLAIYNSSDHIWEEHPTVSYGISPAFRIG